MEGSFGESLSDKVLSRGSSETLIPMKSNKGENLVERSMPPPVFTMEEIEASRQMREYVGDFVKIYREVTDHDPSDVEIARQIKCQG